MRDLRGVVLAGGSGSRLLPLTKTTNKHLLPVGDVPMVYHPVRRLVSAGIGDILVVTGVHHFGALVAQLGSGAEFGCRFTYKVQDQAGGIAEALGLAEDFARGGPVAVVLGDNVFDAPLRPHLTRGPGAARAR
jgi:glucose-1-phosphate thymidylyltransferase